MAGASNYTTEDIDALLDILEVQLPLGAKGWNLVGDEFCEWAEGHGHSPRTVKSLKLKFEQVFNRSLTFHWMLTFRNQLVKTPKPTDDAECPPYIKCSHEIEAAMNDKGGSQDLDNEDIVDSDDAIVISSSDEVDPPPCPKRKIFIKSEPSAACPIACRPASDHLDSAPCAQ